MSLYTRIGVNFWSWNRIRDLQLLESRLLWIALYTSPNSKLLCPGLYKGSIATMSEDSGLTTDQVRAGLDELEEFDMVEYDQRQRVLRMTELPDTGESPANGKVIRAWFRGFKSAPDCPVRNAHVATLRRLLDEWCREHNKLLSADHENAWMETFGGMDIPVRKRSVRRTGAQKDLFDPDPSSPSPTPSGASSSGSDTVSSGSTDHSDAGSEKISSGSAVPNDFNIRETVSDTVRDTVYETHRIRDRERERDRERDLSSSSSGAESGPSLPGDRDRETFHLTLVPPEPVALVPERLVEILAAGGRYGAIVRQDARTALCARIFDLAAAEVGEVELERLAAWIGRGYGPIDLIGGDPASRLSCWASYPGAILRALDDLDSREQMVRDHEKYSEHRSLALAEAMKQLGFSK